MAKTSWHFLLPVALSLDTEHTVYFQWFNNTRCKCNLNFIQTQVNGQPSQFPY